MNITDSTSFPRLWPAPAPTARDKFRRLIWGLIEATLYRWSPRPLHAWRRFILRCFGAKVAMGVHPYPSARIWAPWNLKLGPYSCIGPRVICYSVGLIELGSHAIISQGVHLCAASHDHRDPEFPLVVGSIRIADHAWVAADAFVGPGVIIMDRAVVGARAVVTKDVAPGTVVVGNPARAVGIRQSINQPRMQHG